MANGAFSDQRYSPVDCCEAMGLSLGYSVVESPRKGWAAYLDYGQGDGPSSFYVAGLVRLQPAMPLRYKISRGEI